MTDREIVELYFARDEQAIKETETQYGRYFAYIAERILGNREDAREVVNDVLLHAWSCIPPQRPESLKGFLGRTARMLAIKKAEKRDAEKRGSGQYGPALDELEDCLSGDDGDYSDGVALREALNGFLYGLNREARRVFILRYHHLYSVCEIAQGMGMSESKVKSILFRTRNKLKIYLKEEGFTL